MVLYSKFAYGSQFSKEKKQFEIPILGRPDICKINTAPFFLKHPVDFKMSELYHIGEGRVNIQNNLKYPMRGGFTLIGTLSQILFFLLTPHYHFLAKLNGRFPKPS